MTDHTVLIATGNTGKYEEIGSELDGIDIEAHSLGHYDVKLERPETGESYLENAWIKAEEGMDKTGQPSLADDSGLEVDALDGGPGLYSDRWAGDEVTPEERNQKLLERLEGVPEPERSARFICSMVYLTPGGVELTSRGVCEGRIAFEPRGESGFGYDPIFEVEQKDWKTFGELADRVKRWISHRALALNEMIEQLKQHKNQD